MKTKYIQIQNLNYFDGLYELMGNSISDLMGVEFSITDDKKGEEQYFWMDFFNLRALNEGDLKEEANPQHLSEKLNSGEIDFFIRSAYFPTPEVFYEPKDFCSKTIFQQKNPTTPHYTHICLNETEPLTPENIIKWLQKLSITLFGEQFDFQMGQVESKDEAVIRCKKEFEEGKPYFLKPHLDVFLTY